MLPPKISKKKIQIAFGLTFTIFHSFFIRAQEHRSLDFIKKEEQMKNKVKPGLCSVRNKNIYQKNGQIRFKTNVQ